MTYVARFFPHKNHRQVLRIADRLAATGGQPHFALVGSHGPLQEHISAEVARRGNVSIFTEMGDTTDLLLASDVFIFPSLEEGFGIVALEAAAAGLPVVAAGWDSIREACAPSHRALMFEPDNDVEAIARLELLLSDPVLRQNLARDGRDWVKNFSVEASLRTLLDFYDSALRPPRTQQST